MMETPTSGKIATGKFVFILLFTLLGSCIQGEWVTRNTYRPKNPKFSVLKKPFVANALINNKRLYCSNKEFINYDGKRIYVFTGFYSDGRLIRGLYRGEEELKYIDSSNSWQTAYNVGYYSTKDNSLDMEYFVPRDGGYYYKRQGIIKKDTIILIEKLPILSITRCDTLVVSPYLLKE